MVARLIINVRRRARIHANWQEKTYRHDGAMLLMCEIIAIPLREKIYDIEFLRLWLFCLVPFPVSLPCK